MAMTVRIGSRYLARAVIGQGSFGTVFRADGPQGQVAVKLLRPDLSANPEVVNRFLQERSLLLRLKHPNLVQVQDLVAESDALALVMDLIEGRDLRSVLNQSGPMAPAQAARLVSHVAAGLSYAHRQGVAHRDIKPENVLLNGAAGTPMLVDFGVAELVADATITSSRDHVLGTPAYLAPELAVADPITVSVDVYACGVLLYELVSGRPPFAAEHPLAVVQAHVTETPQRPDEMPADLWQVVASCLSKHPAERPDAERLQAQLAEFADAWESQHPGSEPASQPKSGADGPAGGAVAAPPARTQMLPISRTAMGRARLATPSVPAAPPVEVWQHPAPAPRRHWLLHTASLIVVALVFFAGGYWAEKVIDNPGPESRGEPAEAATRYLSDTPYVQVGNGHGPVELNKANGGSGVDDGGPLTLAGKEYEHGLGAHAPSHIRIYPPPECGTLKAVVGVDESAASASLGTVRFWVHVDGQVRHDSGPLSWQDPPQPISVDLTGATTVDLIVTDANDGNSWDQADWADAHLTCNG
ncbi:MAG: protein kinase domain-containing protein [Micromonosporaceae bacterium]